MMRRIFLASIIGLLALSLMACGTLRTAVKRDYISEELQQGKRDFNYGYYKRALHTLLPLACDGCDEAQYAVGYMYYYGLGVAQDTDVGYFWISRAAKQGYRPACFSLQLIERNNKIVRPKCKIGIGKNT